MTQYLNTVSIAMILGTLMVIYEWAKRKRFSLKGCWSIVSYVFSIVIGGELFLAGLRGDPLKLPTNWQVYICLTGLALACYFGDKLLKHMGNAKKAPILKVKNKGRV